MDITVFDNIDLSKKYQYTLVLTKKNKKPICILNEAYERNLERNLETFDKLSFRIPKYITDETTHRTIENPNYDLIIEENMVLLKSGEPSNPIFEAYFIIKGITESIDKMSKQVDCSSREVMLNKNTVTLDGVERQLVKDSVNTSDGIFDLLSQESTWALNYIDPEAKVDHINGGTSNKYRYFDSISKPWYQFLKEDVSTAFNLVLMYDTVNKKINVYNKDSYGKHTGIILSENNYVKNLNKKGTSESLVTKLVVTGRNGLIFNDVNIYGNDSIYNYDFFRQNGQMSDELNTALTNYDILLNQKNIEFQNIRTQIDNLNVQLTNKNTELNTLNEQLKAFLGIQRGYIESNDNVHLPQATADVNNKTAQIGQKQNEINSINNQINTLNNQLATIANDIDKKNAIYNGTLIFNSELLEELEDFTYVESWNNDYYDNPTLLLNASKDVLKDWSVPTIEYELDVVDLFACAETQMYWDKINLGDFIRIYSDRVKSNVDVRIVSYSYNIDSNDLKIVVSNKNRKNDDARNISSVNKKNTEASKVVNVKKLEWNQVKDLNNAVDLFLNNNLDLARQSVVSNLGRNKINISENGIFVIDADNENNQVAILSGLVAFTNDGWQTANTALDNSGLYAKYLVGQITITQSLYVVNEAGNFSITKEGFILKDNNYKTLISPQGICNSDNIGFPDSVDSDNPYVFDFFIDDNVNVIDKVLLKFSVQDFRAYSKGSASGGSSNPTSSGGGANTYTSGNSTNWSTGWSYNLSTGIYELTAPVRSDSFGSNAFVPQNGLSHVHNISIGNHTHTVLISNHTHEIVPGIYTTPKTIGNMNIYVDGVLRTTISNEKNIVDLTSSVGTKGWHQIIITSSALNRYSASLFIKSYIGA